MNLENLLSFIKLKIFKKFNLQKNQSPACVLIDSAMKVLISLNFHILFNPYSIWYSSFITHEIGTWESSSL